MSKGDILIQCLAFLPFLAVWGILGCVTEAST